MGTAANVNANALQVESSGSSTECGMGANMEVQLSNGNSKILNGIDDATMAAVQLELALEETNAYQIPKLLIAASKVMERAIQSQGRSTTVLYCTFFS
jgi:hypothetical protein